MIFMPFSLDFINYFIICHSFFFSICPLSFMNFSGFRVRSLHVFMPRADLADSGADGVQASQSSPVLGTQVGRRHRKAFSAPGDVLPRAPGPRKGAELGPKRTSLRCEPPSVGATERFEWPVIVGPGPLFEGLQVTAPCAKAVQVVVSLHTDNENLRPKASTDESNSISRRKVEKRSCEPIPGSYWVEYDFHNLYSVF